MLLQENILNVFTLVKKMLEKDRQAALKPDESSKKIINYITLSRQFWNYVQFFKEKGHVLLQ